MAPPKDKEEIGALTPDPHRGLSQLDRVALRIVSAITIAGILTIFSTVYSTKTDIAIIRNDISNLIKNVDGAIGRMQTRILSVEEDLHDIVQNRYTKEDAQKDKEIFNYKLSKNEARIDRLEEKNNK